MFETAAELTRLQQLLDASFARSSSHLTSIMTPERRLAASRIVADVPTPAVLTIATVTARGEPRVSAVDGHFMHGHWRFSTAADSAKARQLLARPAISAGYTPRDGYGVFCHGTAAPLAAEQMAEFRRHCRTVYGEWVDTWGADIAAFGIDAHWMVGFAFPESSTEAPDDS